MLGQHEKNIGNYKYAIIVVTKYVGFNTPEHSGGYCIILHLSGGGGGVCRKLFYNTLRENVQYLLESVCYYLYSQWQIEPYNFQGK